MGASSTPAFSSRHWRGVFWRQFVHADQPTMRDPDRLPRRQMLDRCLYRRARHQWDIKSWELSGVLVTWYYRDLLLRHGTSPQALAERSDLKEQQFYQRLFDDIDLSPVRSVLDIGCGMGNLIEFLHQRGVRPSDYLGIDLVEQFIVLCQNRYQEPCRFLHANFVSDSFIPDRRFDLVTAIGVLVSRVFQYEQYIEHSIRKMIALSSKYVVFNIITEIDSSLGNYNSGNRIGRVTYIPKQRLIRILDSVTSGISADYTIREATIYPDATDAFVRITIYE
jgi:SAM-dependent methyltransferase